MRRTAWWRSMMAVLVLSAAACGDAGTITEPDDEEEAGPEDPTSGVIGDFAVFATSGLTPTISWDQSLNIGWLYVSDYYEGGTTGSGKNRWLVIAQDHQINGLPTPMKYGVLPSNHNCNYPHFCIDAEPLVQGKQYAVIALARNGKVGVKIIKP